MTIFLNHYDIHLLGLCLWQGLPASLLVSILPANVDVSLLVMLCTW